MGHFSPPPLPRLPPSDSLFPRDFEETPQVVRRRGSVSLSIPGLLKGRPWPGLQARLPNLAEMAGLVKASSSSSTLSLGELEEELTCSICLCIFESPVTTPCGHNFCLPCLEMTWGDRPRAFSCPQCRSSFESRPELKKNTVLCRVVEQFRTSQKVPAKELHEEEEKEEKKEKPLDLSVACDSCLVAEAAKTCLTCMASFCGTHLLPHLESPAFRGHQLVRLVKDLQQRKCPTHHKLLEFYCQDHAACVCCLCLALHKACATVPLQEAKEEKELELKKRLAELYSLNKKSSQALDQVRVQQKQVKDTISSKLDLLKSEFLEIRALIQEGEEEAVKNLVSEEKRVYDKYEFVYKVLGKKKAEIQEEKAGIEMALTEDDDIVFLKKAAKLRPVLFKDVFIPKIELDQNLIHTVYQNACGFRENVKQFLTQPKEQKNEGNAQWKTKAQTQHPQPGRKNAASDASKGNDSPSKPLQEKAREDVAAASETKQRRRPPKRTQSPNPRGRSVSANRPGGHPGTLDAFLNKSRDELLEFATAFTLDFNTAHRKVILSERNTKMAVSDTLQRYVNHPLRFTHCSQVVSFQCFKRGIHYWEVEMEHNNFCGIGICYGSMPREGPESRLGRNSTSWCIEWFNARISAWHNDVEKRLPNTKVKKIGVLLNYEAGFVIFFGVAEKITVLYKYEAQFTEALYAAFWIFSSGTTMSICPLK
nr:E3 ubiquitin/ISG15 ligase TRIM25 isoform X1 [Pogona vitticeps]